MMDKFIIINTLISITVYFILHIIILRKNKQNEIFKWLVYLYLMAGFSPFLIGWRGGFIFGSFVSWIFYTFLVLIYVLAILGVMESSIRIRLLKEIYDAGIRGKSLKQILKKYNKDVILHKRLQRFLSAGEISFYEGKYMLENKFTAYTLPDLAIKSIWKLYTGEKL